MAASLEVTKRFATALKKNKSLMGPFAKALAKVLENPAGQLQRKTSQKQAVFSTKLPGIGQGSGQRVLFIDRDSVLIPFAIATHREYEKILNNVLQGKAHPETEKTTALTLPKARPFGDVTPANVLSVLQSHAPKAF